LFFLRSRLVPQLRRTVLKEQPKSIACIGCGRSGLLALTICRELLPSAKLVALDILQKNLDNVHSLGLGALCARVDATNPKALLNAVAQFEPDGVDLVLNLVSVQNSEAGTALIVKPEGTIIYFSMAISFPRAVLSTDVKGAPLNVHLGAGVFPDQCTATLDVLQRNPVLAELFAPPSERAFYLPSARRDLQIRRFAEFCGLSSQTSFASLHRWSLERQDQFYDKLQKFVGLNLQYEYVSQRRGPLLSQVGAKKNFFWKHQIERLLSGGVVWWCNRESRCCALAQVRKQSRSRVFVSCGGATAFQNRFVRSAEARCRCLAAIS
jgi:hypothetical protein